MQQKSQFAVAAKGLLAELVLRKGQVEARPVDRAIDELALAVGRDQMSAPYGAVITSSKDAPEPASVWRTYLHAFDRLQAACVNVASKSSDMIRALKSLDRHGAISLISTSLESNARETIRDFAIHRYVDDVVVVGDVFLLMSGEEMSQVMKHASKASDRKLLLLLHVEAKSEIMRSRTVVEHDKQGDIEDAIVSFTARSDAAAAKDLGAVARHGAAVSAAAKSSAKVARLAEDRSGDDASDGVTLSWRQAFLKSVPTWSADEVASQRGLQAKNRSAAASRLVADGKIFAIAFGGKLRYPQFQFKHGEPRPIITRILHALGDDSSGWDRAYFFATANSYLDDARPMDRLDDKAMEQMLVNLAERHANPADVF